MKLVIRRKALSDISDALEWYETQRSGLSGEFLDALDDCLLKIADHPLAYGVVLRDVRVARPTRFPYKVFFRIRSNTVVVVAVLHGARDPSEVTKRVR